MGIGRYFGAQDMYMLLLLYITTAEVFTHWKRYSACSHPVHYYIMFNWAGHLFMRVLQITAQALAEQGTARKVAAARMMMLVNVYGVFPFLFVWNVVGVYWFTMSHSCIPTQAQEFFAIVMIVSVLYLLLFLYFILSAYEADRWLDAIEARRRAGRPVPVRRQDSEHLLFDEPELHRQPSLAEIRARLFEAANWGYVPLRNGLSTEAIAALPVRQVTAGEASTTCAICLVDLEAGDRVRNITCGHLFHQGCLDEWVQLKSTCPYCRNEVVGQETALV